MRWHQTSIIVLDDVIITSPYDLQDCKTPQSQTGSGKARLERVQKVLQGERSRILTNSPELAAESIRPAKVVAAGVPEPTTTVVESVGWD